MVSPSACNRAAASLPPSPAHLRSLRLVGTSVAGERSTCRAGEGLISGTARGGNTCTAGLMKGGDARTVVIAEEEVALVLVGTEDVAPADAISAG